ncbi:lysozyme g [Alligator mississippiensis]|uniref:lysozyme g n=1 Tax=Alligator mississippiensis TaxID=8496 RepID=UPI002877950B|nr:lysozyme g [Alligator mississippiensis]
MFAAFDFFSDSLLCLERTTPMHLPLIILGLAALIDTSNQSGCYGDINRVDTTGASSQTARPEGLSYAGVRASETIAAKDLIRMNNYKGLIQRAGSNQCVDPAVIAGIISRESHAGAALTADGWGDGGNAFGLMQVDKRYHKLVGKWNSEAHLIQGTQILVGMIKAIQRKFPRWTKEQQLKGGISAYNAGPGNVRTYEKMDIGTTHNDYANDVVARAKFYQKKGF